MRYDDDDFRRQCDRTLSVDDVTMILGVRAHDDNPWVLERLRLLAGYYEPCPAVLVVDVGSAEPHRGAIEEACRAGGFEYLRVVDDGVYSQSVARNRGAAHAKTELLFLSDIDFFGERGLFARLIGFAEAIELGRCFDQLVDLPAYHLTEGATGAVAGDPRSLAAAMTRAALDARGDTVEFIAPYSNVFLCRRSFFDLLGGYDESFRGHGSEDFELPLRWACAAGQFPLPDAAAEDLYGPVTWSFYDPAKRYLGFRRLFELMAFPAELAGLRVAHLHHPVREQGAWMRTGDRRRERFVERVTPYLSSREALLDRDWMPRSRRTLVLPAGEDAVEPLLALRLAGHRLVPSSLADARGVIASGEVDAVAALAGPETDALIEHARAAGLEALAIAPGPEPGSLRYGDADRLAHFVADVDSALRLYDAGPLADLCTRRASLDRRFDRSSYAAARLGLDGRDRAGSDGYGAVARPEAGLARRLRKLTRDPRQFLEESRFGPLRWLGRRLPR